MSNATQILEASGNSYMTAQEAALYLGVSVNSFRRMWRSRAIPAHFITPSRAKFKQTDLDDWLEKQRVVFGTSEMDTRNNSNTRLARINLRKN
jgi:excisionase family DNA binding protein